VSRNVDSQLDALREAGCARVFVDKVSGKLARRPEWDACRDYLRPGDELVVSRLSRVARSVRHLTEVAAELEARGIDLVVLAQGLDTRTPGGRLLFHLLGAIDEFTADLISVATREGLAPARARGRVGGRPTVMTPAKLAVARQLLDSGQHTVTEVAATIGVGRGTLYRHLATETTAEAAASYDWATGSKRSSRPWTCTAAGWTGSRRTSAASPSNSTAWPTSSARS
jgi:DNA invertase Pin-like site-specific DNA recombinase